MKKALRMIKMVIMAILMSVGFSSCESNGDDELVNPPASEDIIIGKNLVRMVATSQGHKTITEYDYDNKRRLSSINYTGEFSASQESAPFKWLWDFTYSDSEIRGVCTGSDTRVESIPLSNGRATDLGRRKCTYDNQGHIIMIGDKNDGFTIVWKDGNISEIRANGTSYSVRFLPSDIPFEKGPMDSYSWEAWDNESLLFFGYLGVRPKNCPKYETYDTTIDESKFVRFTTDSDGYVVKEESSRRTKVLFWK